MNKFGIAVITITFLILVGGAYFLTRPQKPIEVPKQETATYEYFWGNGCPHCTIVAEFLDKWEKKDTIKLIKYEVWYEKANVAIMQDRYNKCTEKPKEKMAVPFMVTPEGKCLIGDGPIIELLKSL
jgi:hypothetical protein